MKRLLFTFILSILFVGGTFVTASNDNFPKKKKGKHKSHKKAKEKKSKYMYNFQN
jgi:hypothetical protein